MLQFYKVERNGAGEGEREKGGGTLGHNACMYIAIKVPYVPEFGCSAHNIACDYPSNNCH